jgi:hypothetical protein
MGVSRKKPAYARVPRPGSPTGTAEIALRVALRARPIGSPELTELRLAVPIRGVRGQVTTVTDGASLTARNGPFRVECSYTV